MGIGCTGGKFGRNREEWWKSGGRKSEFSINGACQILSPPTGQTGEQNVYRASLISESHYIERYIYAHIVGVSVAEWTEV